VKSGHFFACRIYAMAGYGPVGQCRYCQEYHWYSWRL